MQKVNLNTVKIGDYIKLSESSTVVWVRGEYDRSSKKYSIYKFDDINHESFKSGNRAVFIGFDF